MERNEFRIIIIDDNVEIHRDFIKILTYSRTPNELETLSQKIFGKEKSLGLLPQFEIDTATQGKEGLEKITKAYQEGRPYALAFVDIRMPPGWDGVETIEHIWKLDRDIQIVICTAFSDYSWEETIARLGETDNLLILKKPFDIIAVRQLACALTKKWRLMIDTRAENQEKIIHQALHDALTGLPNRILLQERVEHEIAIAERNGTCFSILYFDLNRFKLINDSLGHAAGDMLLCEFAKRLNQATRKTDTLARIGGDEFVMLVTNLVDEDDIFKIVKKIMNAIHQPFDCIEKNYVITVSVGVSNYPRDGKTYELLIANADSAMVQAKKSGMNQCQFYTEAMHKESSRRLELETELRRALENKEFVLYYQPQVNSKTGEVFAVEALIRWNHPTRGLLSPLEFIPIAEDSGLIVQMGDWVLQEACRQNKAWREMGLRNLQVSVNVTAPQLRQENFPEKIQKLLAEVNLEPSSLDLELTESSIVNNTETIDIINKIKSIGVHISLDDFGTGYSSLNCLRSVSPNRLKIDQSFVRNINENHGDEVIIQAIVSMARSLNLDVIAEGVETAEQLVFLQENNCQDIQGYIYSKPLSVEQLEEYLHAHQ